MTCKILLGCRLVLSAPHLSISIMSRGKDTAELDMEMLQSAHCPQANTKRTACIGMQRISYRTVGRQARGSVAFIMRDVFSLYNDEGLHGTRELPER